MQIALLAGCISGNSFKVGFQFLYVIFVAIRQTGGGDDIGIQFSEQLHIHRRPHADANARRAVASIKTVFRRRGGSSHQPSARVRALSWSGKVGSPLPVSDRLATNAPCPAYKNAPTNGRKAKRLQYWWLPTRMLAGSGVAPDVGHHVMPTLRPCRYIKAVAVSLPEKAGGAPSGWSKADRVRKGRLFQRPMIHLDIDVGVIVAVPRCRQGIRPKPTSWAAGCRDGYC